MQLELSRAQTPRHVVAWHLLHKLATITILDFPSAHMLLKLKLMNLRVVVPIWGWSKASTPYLI